MSKASVRVMHHYFVPRFFVARVVCDTEAELYGDFDVESSAEIKARELAKTGKGQFIVVCKRTTWEGVQK